MRKRVLRIASLLLIFAVLFGVVTTAFVVSDTTDLANVTGFYRESEGSLDVVCIGPSEMYAAYAPGLAYEKYGYTSYDFCVGAIPSSLFPSVLNEVYSKQNPKLLVVNANGFLTGTWNFDNELYLREWIDNLPLSENKYETIRTAVPADMQKDFYIRLRKYHGNWRYPFKLARAAFLRAAVQVNGSRLKGVCTTSSSNEGKMLEMTQELCFDESVQASFDDFADSLKAHGAEKVLFIAMPHQMKNVNESAIRDMKTYVCEKGYDFLDLDKAFAEIGIDEKEDFHDGEHLNSNGMRKFTDYLGNYIVSNYDIITEHSEATAEKWQKAVEDIHTILDYADQNMGKKRKGAINELDETDLYFDPDYQERLKDRYTRGGGHKKHDQS